MAVNKRDLSTLEGETGWPVVNYAQEERNFQTSHNQRTGALSIPRFKFTWLVEFNINPRVLENPVTNLNEFIQNGKLYTHLLTLDHPSPTFKTEKLRSYNKWINVPVQVEFPQATMSFHDDSTSVVMALWKEHLNFYTHLAQVGDSISGEGVNSNLGSSQETNSYGFTHILTGEEQRAKMEERPSLGMRLKANDMRHFFESIVIYDLGTEPDGINVYWFHKPMITGWAHDNLDKEDRTGNVRVSATFDYESMYFTIGQNRGRLAQTIQTILGATPDNIAAAPRKDGIARDGRQSPIARKVENGSGGSPLSTFPGEDELALQQALSGAGLQGNDVSVAANNIAEQLASPAGLNSPANALKQTLEQAGADLGPGGDSLAEATAKTFPLGQGPAGQDLIAGPIELVEPLAPNQTRPIIPPGAQQKQRDLDQVRREKGDLLALSDQRELTRPEKERLGGLAFREDELEAALHRQQAAQAIASTNTTSERSALDNTTRVLGTPVSEVSGTAEPPGRPLVIRITGDAADASERRIENLDSRIAQNREAQSSLRSRGGLGTTRDQQLQSELNQLESARAAEVQNFETLLASRPGAGEGT